MYQHVATFACLMGLLVGYNTSSAQTDGVPGATDRSNHLASTWRLIDAFNESDIETIAALFGDSVSVDRNKDEAKHGGETVDAFFEDFLLAFPDAYAIPVQVLALGPQTVLLEWILEGTHLGSWSPPGKDSSIPATGRTVRFSGGGIIGFDDSGLIDRIHVRIDIASLVSQVEAGMTMDDAESQIRSLGERYTAAWNSQDPASVAAFFSEEGSLTINGGSPSEGREAIAAVAAGFMTAFPDMELVMDDVHVQGDRAVYQWTFSGTNTGPGGTGKHVRFSGFEVWQIGSDNLIQRSRGYFDTAVYQHQLEAGVD